MNVPPPSRENALTPPAKRRRLLPEQRRQEILDHAAKAVQAGGANVLMEPLARSMGISKSLLYAYFPSRSELLAALMRREQAELRRRGIAEALAAEGTFRDVLERTTRVYLEQCADRGSLLGPLTADPEVTRLMEGDNRRERERTIRYFAGLLRKAYGAPDVAAPQVVDMLMAVTGRAGEMVGRGELGASAATTMAVSLIMGGLTGVAAEWGWKRPGRTGRPRRGGG